MIYDGPDNTYPILGGPYSGTNLPPQINSTGCVTIDFISDVNVADEGFFLSWQSQVAIPPSPNISLPVQPNCSSSTFSIQLDQNIHCDSVSTAFISVGGQINQTVNATPLNCINDSTNRNLSQVLFKIIEIVVITAMNFVEVDISNSIKNNKNNKKYTYKPDEVCS